MISIIIPTLNDERTLPALLIYVRRVPFVEYISEIIISDGNSSDDTVRIAESFEVKVIKNEKAGRALQMNAGARAATGTILYFLNADSLPPRDFAYEIINQYENGKTSGSFRLQFDHYHWLLRLNAWFTRFNLNWVRFGDQSLYIQRELFNSMGGFREDHIFLENLELVNRIKSAGNGFVVMPRYITTSARKYRDNGVYKIQWVNICINTLYLFGVSQGLLQKKYQELLSPKL